MKVTETDIPGVVVIEPVVFGDSRGWFMEGWHRERYAASGLPAQFVQDNHAFSRRGVLRGLHAQHPFGQGKLVQVLQGEVFDVAVDIRAGSPWFGRWVAATLSGENKRQFYIPPGFAHGYYVLTETSLFSYKCTEAYHPETELAVRWNDPAIGIEWPGAGAPELSEKDACAPLLAELDAATLPTYAAHGRSR